MRVQRHVPSRVGLGALVIASVILSPILVVYEFVLGFALVISGQVARFVRPNSSARAKIQIIGLALLAGPIAYAIAWLLGLWFDW
jgi:uncharacterized membrane protein